MINFDRIIDDIFVGTCPTHQIDIHRLKQAGFAGVLNLQTDEDFEKLGISWKKMEEWYVESEISVQRVPIIDFDDSDLIEKLPGAVQRLENMAGNSNRILVHCTAGQQRSPSTVIGYLAWKRNLTLQEAIDIVSKERKCAPPIHVLESLDSMIKRKSL